MTRARTMLRRALLVTAMLVPMLPGLPVVAAHAEVPRAHWALWLGAYSAEDGRIIDDANDRLTHSESQGYGLLLALAFNDRPAFARIWSWTEQNLWVRDDGLLAWAWRETAEGGGRITDINNATDGDILVAWALLEAGQRWDEARYTDAGRLLANAIIANATVEVAGQILIRPGVEGFASENQIVNPSYWVFPALQRLADLTGDAAWERLHASGLWLLERVPTTYRLVPEWTALTQDGNLTNPEGLDTVAGYNAVRAPLYLIWAGETNHPVVGRYLTVWGNTGNGTVTVVDNVTGMPLETSENPGYRALAALTSCALDRPAIAWPDFSINQPYYPATLHLLAELVASRRYPSCYAPQ